MPPKGVSQNSAGEKGNHTVIRPLAYVPEADLAKERDIAAAQVVGKPPAAVQKIVEGKLEKYYSTVCLLDQPFVLVAKTGLAM